MEITKNMFINFLKANNFYEAWMEGFDINKEIYEDEITVDEFISEDPTSSWLYNGVFALTTIYQRPCRKGILQNRYDRWRDTYLDKFMELEKKWYDYILKISAAPEVSMWVTRDKTGYLCLSTMKPTKGQSTWNIEYAPSRPYDNVIELNPALFPNVTWEDAEPTEVVLTININDYE